MLTLLRMVNSRRWKKQLICPFPVLSANGAKVCHATRFVNLPHMAITVSLLWPVSEILLSFHIMTVNNPPSP
jgi:hypothetical protein